MIDDQGCVRGAQIIGMVDKGKEAEGEASHDERYVDRKLIILMALLIENGENEKTYKRPCAYSPFWMTKPRKRSEP
jgi:hypothetical protein